MRAPVPGAGERPDRRPVATSGGPGDPVPADGSVYWDFYEEVAARQLAAWAPREPSRVLDLSGDSGRFAAQLAQAGHTVVHAARELPLPPLPEAFERGGSVLPVRADARELDWLADAVVDAVLAESRALSLCLATEVVVADLHRVLRPGGRLLLVVDSLGLGLARLAEQGRWAELADVPSADVVLVPDSPDGSVTRCFWPEELHALLQDAGFTVESVRPRTVLSPASVERAVAQGGRAALTALVESELSLEGRTDSPGLHLVASAYRVG